MLPIKFKAAILVSLKAPLELAEIESAERLRFGQVLVKVHYSGICGAQINEIEGAKGRTSSCRTSWPRRLRHRTERAKA